MNKMIKTAEEHSASVHRLSTLLDADPPSDSAEADELELLAHLIEEYEKKHHDLGQPAPLTAIIFRMEQQGLSRKDLVPYLGSPSRVSEVLNGKRPLSVEMIRRLHRGLDIPAESLLAEPDRMEVSAKFFPPKSLPPAEVRA